ncbi:MAG: hypothetical protein ACRDOK_09120 [Streptosporangiaceae bacterium]
MRRRRHCSPAVAAQDAVAELVGGQFARRDRDEQRQILRTRLKAFGSYRRQRGRDRVLPLRGLLQGLVLLY